MSAIALLLILLSAGIHATWNLFAKRLPGGAESVWLFTLIAVVIYAPFAAGAVWTTGYRPDGPGWTFLIGTGVFQAVYFVVLRRGYAAGDLSVVYPLARGTGPIWAVLLATTIIGEQPTALTIAGAIIISTGTLVLATPIRAGRDYRLAILYGLATGLVIGSYTAWDGYAVRDLAIPAVLLAWAGDVGRVVWFSPVAWQRRAELRGIWTRHRLEVSSIGVLSTGSYLMVLSAMAIAPISSIAPAREIGIVIGTVLGMTVLREPGGRRRILSAMVIATGVVLVALG